MQFQIKVRTGMDDFVMNVDRVNITKISEDFIISNRDGTKTVTIRSNRPKLRNRIGTKRWKPEYVIVDSTKPIIYKNYLDDAFLEIMREIEPDLFPRPKPRFVIPKDIKRFEPDPKDKLEKTPWHERRNNS